MGTLHKIYANLWRYLAEFFKDANCFGLNLLTKSKHTF